jgi:RimJ/RimL family protein N-acetyltransferase
MLLKMTDLETARLHLREFRQTDLAGVAAWEETLHADQFLEFCFRSYREWGMGPWAMLLKASGALVGNCGFCRIGYDRAPETFEYCGEANYYVAPRYRGAGLATEALQAALKFGFGDLKLTRIQGRCSPGNPSSERVMQKAGLKFERMIAPSAGAPSQDKLYAITRELYPRLPASPRFQP